MKKAPNLPLVQTRIRRPTGERWEASDAKSGTLGKVLVFPYEKEWEGQFYEEKEVTVYYKLGSGRHYTFDGDSQI